MSEQKFVIEASERKETGKKYARKLRSAGKIPANLIGKGQATSLELDPKLLTKIWRVEGKRFDLKIGSDSKEATIHELQIDPVKRTALHVDLKYV